MPLPKTTPFHECLAPFNETGIWKHWSGYLAAPRYQYSTTAEYYAIRNAVAVLDTSPLFKYRISGVDSVPFLQSVMITNVYTSRPASCPRSMITIASLRGTSTGAGKNNGTMPVMPPVSCIPRF
ncbi:MAG: hypothetical protein HQ515_08375 [Phycisphaeraceae bacterium]|nr:hypothetical protein [Phycisphaeraceae bacterium]